MYDRQKDTTGHDKQKSGWFAYYLSFLARWLIVFSSFIIEALLLVKDENAAFAVVRELLLIDPI